MLTKKELAKKTGGVTFHLSNENFSSLLLYIAEKESLGDKKRANVVKFLIDPRKYVKIKENIESGKMKSEDTWKDFGNYLGILETTLETAIRNLSVLLAFDFKARITPKMDILLTVVVPFARKWNNLGIFREERVESLHAKINILERVLACIRKTELRLLAAFMRQELKDTNRQLGQGQIFVPTNEYSMHINMAPSSFLCIHLLN